MTIAIIPARGGSKGIINKNLQCIGNIPLVARTISAAKRCQDITHVFVTTDCEQIAAVSQAYGANVIVRPSNLSSDTARSEDALLHALEEIRLIHQMPEKFVFLQCTSPFTKPSHISKVLSKVTPFEVNSAFSVSPWHGFLWDIKGEGINHDHLASRRRRQDIAPQYLETGAVYAMVTDLFVVNHSRFISPSFPVIIDDYSPEIDSAHDLLICQQLDSILS